MAPETRRVTIRDVAREAGVSITTVSDALNDRGRLPDATREHVADAAARLGYRAHVAARRLRTGRTGHVALYCPLVADIPAGLAGTGYYMELAMGAAEAAFAAELALVLLPPRLTPERIADVDVDGVIVADPMRGDPVVAGLVARGIPIVTCESDPTAGARHAGCVQSDHGAALTELLDHLAEQGARRPALVAPGDETAWSAELGAAYRTWCAAHGVAPLAVTIPLSTNPTYSADAARALLDGDAAPDAIVCAPDGGGAAVVRALVERGFDVPGDVLVASCVDGATMLAGPVPVTAIDLRPGLAGAKATRLLAELLIDNQPGPRVEQLPTRLVVRASTTPASAG
jgi:DNA-binding LacI/PurR family transcriptional regulator